VKIIEQNGSEWDGFPPYLMTPEGNIFQLQPDLRRPVPAVDAETSDWTKIQRDNNILSEG